MEGAWTMILVLILILILIMVVLIWAWKIVNRLWLRPKKLERVLREQGLEGNPYTFMVGDMKQILKSQKEGLLKPMNLFSHDIIPRVSSYLQHTLHKHDIIWTLFLLLLLVSRNSFIWYGPTPRVTLTDPELIKEVLNKIYDFRKELGTNTRLLAPGLLTYEGEKWSKHRKIINPVFNILKLKNMLPVFIKCCDDMITKWEGMLCSDGWCEMEIGHFLQNLTCDAISRTAFGSNYEEGRRIFEYLKEQGELLKKLAVKDFIPGWRLVPTPSQRRIKEINRYVQGLVIDVIEKREKALKMGEAPKDILLDILLESNRKEIEEQGNHNNVGLSVEEVIDECKLFFLAGQETTSSLLVWTIILLSMYPDWQARAREEVFKVFGNREPDFDGIHHLKIATMILYEVLRLYPPLVGFARKVHNDVKLGNLSLPAGVHISLPVALVHHSCELWGDDAKEFKPERFSEGLLKATDGKVSFFPFGGGPRICMGQNFSLFEVKITLSMILQRFSIELSPTYVHAPRSIVSHVPQYGAHVILRKVENKKYNN